MRRDFVTAVLSVISSMAVGEDLRGQLGRVRTTWDVLQITGNSRFAGAVRTDLGGQERFWVTAGADPMVVGARNKLYELDRAGALLNTYDQPGSYPTELWGIVDLTWDGQYLYGADESGIVHAFDLAARRFDANKSIGPVQGMRSISSLAYDVRSDTFWTMSDSGATAYQFRRDGTIVWSGPGGTNAVVGAAYDLARNKLWWFGQTPFRATGIEFDPVTKTTTGTRFLGDFSPTFIGAAQGLEFYYLPNGEPTLLCVVARRLMYQIGGAFVYGWSCTGGSGMVPEIGMNHEAPWLGNANWAVTLTRVPGATHGLLFMGRSKTAFAGQPLPFSMGGLGVPCTVLAAWEFPVGVAAVQQGSAAVPVPLPNERSLSYLATFWQWLVVDPTAANPMRITTSNGGQTVLLANPAWY